MTAKGIGGHTLPNKGATDSWITPREIVTALGEFDLDPCQCVPQPWPCAKAFFTEEDNGLMQPWNGRVWLNPPYSKAEQFLQRLADHGRGTALIFARTETEMFKRFIWERASAVMFLWGRLYFHYPDGTRANGNSGAPSVLVTFGARDAAALLTSNLGGSVVQDWVNHGTTNSR